MTCTNLELGKQQLEAYQLILNNSSSLIKINGGAGTGKTQLIKALQAQSCKKIAYLAPTGRAARNIDGQTIHSFFRLPTNVIIPGSLHPLTHAECNLVSQFDIFILDESSMIRADVMQALDERLRSVLVLSSHLPFGGKKIVLIGDELQLPPVVTPTDYELLRKYFTGYRAIDAPVIQSLTPQTFELTDVYRQSDCTFIAILQAIRSGNLIEPIFHTEGSQRPLSAVEALNTLITVTSTQPRDSLVLCEARFQADRINNSCKLQFMTEQISHIATIRGQVDESSFQVPFNLSLKIGSPVILLANHRNRNGQLEYCNGDFATVIGEAEMGLIIQLEDGRQCTITRKKWEQKEYGILDEGLINPLPVLQTVGYVEQMPVCLAHAISIHKSQGMTLKKVHLVLSDNCTEGLAYVGLTRVRNLSDLTVNRPFEVEDFMYTR